MPHMEPVEEFLNIELFLGKTRMTTRIGGRMEPEVHNLVTECVRRNVNIFAFKPTDLKGIDPKISMYRFHEDLSVKSVKPKLKRF